jgi:hypothetical protein
MKQVVWLAIAAGIAIGIWQLQGALAARKAQQAFKSAAEDLGPALRRAEAAGGVSEYTIQQLVQQWAGETKNVSVDENDVEVFVQPIDVAGDGSSCPMPDFPPVFRRLTIVDQGAIKNLAIRCQQGLAIVGFRAKARIKGRGSFTVERFSFAKSWGG